MKAPDNTHILIIDDNEDIVFMLKAMLTLKGYLVDVRTNTDKLEEHLLKKRPNLILMDMLLSGSDGREICKKLKANKAFSDIPIIMISAHPTAKHDCLKAGSDFFLAKPFDMKNLFEKVHEAL
ncbi:response regulator [Cryomorpha ignava]|uniref:Response regulator n=1 Tax=Cryomorpha ignava TaxID=101383 RepID=A0A7K3WY95_9FLAO|nr:response regulator [Cryomorpha ignava]NEN25625.1 response regulator [Cryomorpha ignava]